MENITNQKTQNAGTTKEVEKKFFTMFGKV